MQFCLDALAQTIFASTKCKAVSQCNESLIILEEMRLAIKNNFPICLLVSVALFLCQSQRMQLAHCMANCKQIGSCLLTHHTESFTSSAQFLHLNIHEPREVWQKQYIYSPLHHTKANEISKQYNVIPHCWYLPDHTNQFLSRVSCVGRRFFLVIHKSFSLGFDKINYHWFHIYPTSPWSKLLAIISLVCVHHMSNGHFVCTFDIYRCNGSFRSETLSGSVC